MSEKKKNKWIECRMRISPISGNVVVQAKNNEETAVLKMLTIKMCMDAANQMVDEVQGSFEAVDNKEEKNESTDINE